MKAIALFSGGLDSVLAMKLVIDQGIDVVALNINMGFSSKTQKLQHMQNMCEQVGAELKTVDIQDEFLKDVLFSPKHGYGKHFNPCIDCHAKMFEVAKRIMDKEGASFLISGEVIGQRPMSQNKDALQKVLNQSNCEGLLLRPLSAKMLEPTIAELQGWVDREKLEGIVGRNRERQLEMAQEMGLEDFESPGGGCLLTDANFAKKMKEFIKYDKFEVKDIPVVKHGRHFRLANGAKLIIGRNQEENEYLQDIKNDKYYHIKTVNLSGPHAMLEKKATSEELKTALMGILTYCKTSPKESYTLCVDGKEIQDSPFESKEKIQIFNIL